ncbi:hypothetical protein C8R44DRAFT_749955 [Mycena epipterygia]|nr:hypothetical protein C8R44DRAFT_749955 [Mycena epipterygia]
MSSSALGTPSPNPLSDVFGAMNEDSPIVSSLTNAQKRSYAAIDGSTSDDEEGSTGGAPIPALVLTANQNTTSALQRYSEKKRLRVDQTTEVTFLLHFPLLQGPPPAFRHAKILTNIFQVSNQFAAFVVAQPGFEVASRLEKNISNYAAAILLSRKISAYKGSIPINTLLNILKKFRFDLPAGIENNPADYAKVVAAIQEAFTQLRAKFKKALCASLKANKTDKTIAPGPEHQNIFKLTQIFVDGTQCTATIELCARVALMCIYLIRESGPRFEDKIQRFLHSRREQIVVTCG